jgi:hypothetical protein
MFKLPETDLLTSLQDRVMREALRHKDMVDEWARMEQTLGGAAVAKVAMAMQSAELEELRHPERALLREMQVHLSGRAAIREAMEWITGQTAQKEAAKMAATMNGSEIRKMMTDRAIAEASELNSVRQRLQEQSVGYVTFNDLAARAELDRFTSAVRSVSPTICADWALQHAMMLQTPWIDEASPARSFEAFAAVSKIALAVEEARSSKVTPSSYLRSLVGSWVPADPVAFAVSSAVERARALAQSGIDGRVIDLPKTAFPEVARVTGLAPVPAVRAPRPAESAIVIEASGSLSDDATLQVRSVEQMLRHELRERMPRHFGPNWITQRVPEKMRCGWQERREKSRRGKRIDLLDFSHFGDLVQIIMQKGVWETAFMPSIGMSKEEFQIATNRLIEIRNVLNHAGELEVIEFVWCFSEVTQLRRAFGTRQDGEESEQ